MGRRSEGRVRSIGARERCGVAVPIGFAPASQDRARTHTTDGKSKHEYHRPDFVPGSAACTCCETSG